MSAPAKAALAAVARQLDAAIEEHGPSLTEHELRSACRGAGFVRAAIRSLTERGVTSNPPAAA